MNSELIILKLNFYLPRRRALFATTLSISDGRKLVPTPIFSFTKSDGSLLSCVYEIMLYFNSLHLILFFKIFHHRLSKNQQDSNSQFYGLIAV